MVENFVKKAVESVNPEKNPVLFFFEKELEHGLIGLVAGKLTEQFNRPSMVLCEHHEKDGSVSYVASCRAPEWCDIMVLLDDSKELFIRYGGHKQAAGFSVSPENFEKLQEKITQKFLSIFGENIPNKTLKVESSFPLADANISFLETMDTFRPFGIGNPKPLWLLENITIFDKKFLGEEQKHIKIFAKENPNVPILMWNVGNAEKLFQIGEEVSLVVDFDKNIWQDKVTIQAFVKAIIEK